MSNASDTEELHPRLASRLSGLRAQANSLQSAVESLPTILQDAELSSALAKALADYSGERSRLIERARDVMGPILAALENLDDAAPTDAFVAVDSAKINKLEIVQRAARLANQAEDLAARGAEEFATIVERKKVSVDATLTAVHKDLLAIGQGPEATLAGQRGTNPVVARRQFDQLKQMNVRVRKAQADVARATQFLASFQNTARVAKQRATELQNLLAKIATRDL